MQVADWKNDWLYSLILAEAHKEQGLAPYVLVEEYSSADDSLCFGKVIRAWILDGKGLREIGLSEDNRQRQKMETHDPYPFVLFMFHIHPDRKRVVMGHAVGRLGGSGTGYLVKGEGPSAVLRPDPQAVFWVS